MRKRFTLPQIYARGYTNGDIDQMIALGFATYGSKSGAIVLLIEDITGVDEYFAEQYDRRNRRR